SLRQHDRPVPEDAAPQAAVGQDPRADRHAGAALRALPARPAKRHAARIAPVQARRHPRRRREGGRPVLQRRRRLHAVPLADGGPGRRGGPHRRSGESAAAVSLPGERVRRTPRRRAAGGGRPCCAGRARDRDAGVGTGGDGRSRLDGRFLRDAARRRRTDAHGPPHARCSRRERRSVRRARRAAGEDHRHADSRRRRVPLDTEMKRLTLCVVLVWTAAASAQQQIQADAWPTYNGDYTGRRFSALTKINADNVKHLGLAWSYRLSVPGSGPIKGTPLMVDGIIYLTAPDHVWTVDARTGREIWHWENRAAGGIQIGNRGVGVKGDYLYVETRDCNLVSLTIKDGK